MAKIEWDGASNIACRPMGRRPRHPFQPKEWVCSNCQEEHPRWRVKCDSCGAERPRQ